MYGHVLHSTPPLYGGAIDSVESDIRIKRRPAGGKPKFSTTIPKDVTGMASYRRAMLDRIGINEYEQAQRKAKKLLSRLNVNRS